MIFDAVENLLNEIPDSQAVQVIDLTWGLNIAEKANINQEFFSLYLPIAAATITELFTGSIINAAEKFASLQAGHKLTDFLNEVQLTTPVGYHLAVKIPNKPYALAVILNHTVNLSTAWSSVRAGAVKLNNFL